MIDNENLNDHLVGIAIGIRYKQNYSIIDLFGAISDKVLYSGDTFFTPDVFPLRKISAHELILINEKTNDRLVFNHQNTLLELNFTENDNISIVDLGKIFQSFDSQIIKGVLNEFSISRIVRVGLIKKFKITDKSLTESFLHCTISESISNIKDVNLRFSKRYETREALVKNDDYINVIYTISKFANQDDEVRVNLDYQRFYEPDLSSSAKIKFPRFLDDAKHYESNTFITWLNDFHVNSTDETEENHS